MSYLTPDRVTSPHKRWKLVEVLLDNGPDKTAYALGKWDGEWRVACRWNGTDERPKGNPNSTGKATWFILGPEMHPFIDKLEGIPADKLPILKAALGK